MIYKVLFQDTTDEYPVRERTKCLYLEADSEREVRKKLINHDYNIEYIQPLSELHLQYEKRSEDFSLENV